MMARVATALASATAAFVLASGSFGAETAAVGPEESRAVVRQFFAAINRGDAKAAAALFDPAASNYSQPVPRDARLFFQTGIEDILQTFPDWHMEIVDLAAEANDIVALCRVRGTHRGVGHLPLNGGLLVEVPPTGRRIDVAHIHWFQVRNRKIVDHSVARDDVGMYRQLGMLQTATVSETSGRLASTVPIVRTPEQWKAADIDRNKQTVREFFERENAREMDKLATPVQTAFKDILRTFPDWHWSVIRIIGQGDSVVTLVRASGTHQGVSQLPINGALLVGVAPTGKHFDVWHIHWFKFADGRITADYRTRDDIGLYKQLGVLTR
jgi:predicted ester cyclase